MGGGSLGSKSVGIFFRSTYCIVLTYMLLVSL